MPTSLGGGGGGDTEHLVVRPPPGAPGPGYSGSHEAKLAEEQKPRAPSGSEAACTVNRVNYTSEVCFLWERCSSL